LQDATSREPGDRLFFALWPDAELLQVLIERLPALAVAPGARPQRPDQWHVTLEFLGQVPPARQALLREAAEEAVAGSAPFTVRFDRLEHWRKPQVLCLAGQPRPPLLQLVTALRSALAQRGFEPDARAFRPHVTLARKVRRASAGCVVPPLDWPAAALALVRSVTGPGGSRYEPLVRWNLGGAAG
jgi:2'-5' RNA ligase